MADQATVNGGARVARINSPLTDGVIGNLAGLGGDIASLAELQAKLAAADLKEVTGRAALPTTGVAIGAALGLGSVPVLLFGIAELITANSSLRLHWSLLLTAVVALVLAGLIAWLSGTHLGRSFEALRRSRDELARNVAWIKTVLAHSGRPAPHRRAQQ